MVAYEKANIKDFIKLFQDNRNGNDAKILLVSAEIENISDIREISETLLHNNGIYILIPPINCSELNEDVDKRMTRARQVRK
jgi:hypothetical protein